jgi:HEPN domain-containing protein
MAYPANLQLAARRHLDAAAKLEKNGRDDVAGYLYGIAAECAVKAMARVLPGGRDDDVFYAHFPQLRTLIREKLSGRGAQPLLRLVQHDGFLNQWDITMRYAAAAAVREKPLAQWAEQARQLVNIMEGLV